MENIKRIIMLLMAAIIFVMMPACALAENAEDTNAEATEAPAEENAAEENAAEENAEADENAADENADADENAEAASEEETKKDMNFIQKLGETGKITVLGMVGIFAVMIVIFLVITILNKVTK